MSDIEGISFDGSPSDDEVNEDDFIDPQPDDVVDYVQQLDFEQNERVQEEEQEMIRLWEAKVTLLEKLIPPKASISSPIDPNVTSSEIDSNCGDTDSIMSEPTDYPKLTPKDNRSVKSFSFSTRLRPNGSGQTSPSTFIQRDRTMSSSQSENSSIIQGQNGPYQNSDDRTSGMGSLVPSPVIWRSERVLGRGFCSASIDYDRINPHEIQPIQISARNPSSTTSDPFKEVRRTPDSLTFASLRARMEATSIASASASPTSFDDSSTNPLMLNHPNKTHFDHDEEFNYHQNYVLPKLIQEEKERQKELTTIDFSFKIGRDEPVTTTDPNGTVTEDEPYLSIIVDNNNNGLNRVRNIFDQYQLDYDRELVEHDQWYYGLISYTFLLKQSVKVVNSSVMKLLQQQLQHGDTFWLSNGLKKRPIFNDPFFNIDETAIASSSNPNEQGDPSVNPSTRLNKYRQLARCFFSINCQMEWSSGALVTMNTFSSYEKLSKQPYQKWQLRFCEDFVDFIYQDKDHSDPNCEYIKRLPANFIDKSVIITTSSDGFVLYVQMKGNAIDLINTQPWWLIRKRRQANQPVLPTRQAIQRQATRTGPKPFCSTLRISVKVSTLKDSSQRKADRRFRNQTIEEYEFQMDRIVINHIRVAFREFLAFFYRHGIQICFAGSIMDLSLKSTPQRLWKPVFNTFLKNYSWQMLNSIGYRFQHRVTQQFIDYLHSIESEEEFYRTSLHIERRAKEYHFLDLYDEVMKYAQRTKENLTSSERRPTASLVHSSKNMAYALSVSITPTTILVKPMKLAKTNRIIREPKFGGVMNFCLVEMREETGETLQAHDFGNIRWKIDEYLKEGFHLTSDRLYRYLHHSQSQLKDKQFWFYWYDEKGKTNLSFQEAYNWMGDFNHERVVAKHSARMAQCFTSSAATIRVPVERTEIIDDIERNGYIFTDGVGTFSSRLRDEICAKMGFRRKFSVMQIRYGGCKGTVSVNPELDYTEKQLILRKSMHKFISTHDVLELCKISAPRPIHLNRQVIALLESRFIPHSTFLLLQSQHLHWLIESLLYLPSTFQLLNERLPAQLFQLRDLIRVAQVDLIHEPFFRQLITTICKHEVKRMQVKTRIQISRNYGRNMFGIVDETGILEYGQVFCQYTELDTETLEDTNRPRHSRSEVKHVVVGKIVVTKNPCHHPGDLRTFEAIDVPQLRHLVDCIVFPQKGHRPHPNEISGSDLDGDEYAVYWHPDLIPTSENFAPYEYDSQEKPKKLDRPVTREDICRTVLEISEQDALGRLSNLHLAFTDQLHIRHPDAIRLAAAIAEEVDAGKTGKHPLTDEQIAELARKLNNERPDFFNRPKQYDQYPSSNAIGILYRAVCRSDPGWTKINRCLHTKTTIGFTQSSHVSAHVQIDPLLTHSLAHLYMNEAEHLFKLYREQISDIMCVYHFHSEVDLICKFDSQQQTLSKQFDIADSAQIELSHLNDRIRSLFQECQLKTTHPSKCSCDECDEHRMARAAACYLVTYQQPFAKKILSFAWLFSSWLVKLRRKNLEKQPPEKRIHSNFYLVGQAFLHSFLILIEHQGLRFTVKFDPTVDESTCILRLTSDQRTQKYIHLRVTLMEWAMLEVVSGWLDRQEILTTKKYASRTTSRPTVHYIRTWKHIATQFLFAKYQPTHCSPLLLCQNRFSKKESVTVTNDKNISVTLSVAQFASSTPISSIPEISRWWSDESACRFYKLLLTLTAQCSRTHTLSDSSERMDLAYLNEYLTLGLLAIAAENEFGNIMWQ